MTQVEEKIITDRIEAEAEKLGIKIGSYGMTLLLKAAPKGLIYTEGYSLVIRGMVIGYGAL